MGEPLPPVFLREGDQFVPTASAASPWGRGLLHGGPPAGLLARAIEQTIADDEMQVARLTIDLFRPVPRTPLTITTRFAREGRRIAVIDASLMADGVEVSRASALVLRRSEVSLPVDALPPPSWIEGHEDIPTTGLMGAPRDGQPPRGPSLTGFHTTIEVRRVGGAMGTGRGTAWIRIPVDFVAGEPTSPLVRLAATSDFGNALGHLRPTENVGFINADISIHIHRLPEGEWVCLETRGVAQPFGLGLIESVVHDIHGPIGRVNQAVMVNRRQSG